MIQIAFCGYQQKLLLPWSSESSRSRLLFRSVLSAVFMFVSADLKSATYKQPYKAPKSKSTRVHQTEALYVSLNQLPDQVPRWSKPLPFSREATELVWSFVFPECYGQLNCYFFTLRLIDS
jgi:hypothetical protein